MRTYVVTGSASGVGAAVQSKLEAAGHRVIGIDLAGAEVVADLSTPEGRSSAVEAVLNASEGTVDAIIACAGISHPVPQTISVNFYGVVDLLTALQGTLAKSGAPRAVAISSMATLQANDPKLVGLCLTADETQALARAAELAAGGPEEGAKIYGSSKRALSRWIRRESVTPAWAGAGIPLNAVAPGIILTPMVAPYMGNEDAVKYLDSVVPMPLNYHQKPEVVADLAIWLASEENTHCCGQTIYCDGGSDVVLRGDDVWSWAD